VVEHTGTPTKLLLPLVGIEPWSTFPLLPSNGTSTSSSIIIDLTLSPNKGSIVGFVQFFCRAILLVGAEQKSTLPGIFLYGPNKWCSTPTK
jgi:hypothetical protein